MDVQRGFSPLSEADLLDFVYNYFKAEYAPIRWLFTSTADAVPKQAQRWIFMGNELFPTTWRPANPQTQADLASLDNCIQRRKLDGEFVRGMVVRYAKHQKHERLEKKLCEVGRKDLMVCKALKEKHLIDTLWPSPAPASLPKDLLAQGVEVRRWYGDMFFKYFRSLHAVNDFTLRPEVEHRIKTAGVHMLVPYVEHILAGPIEPIRRIVANGAGFAHSPGKREVMSFGKPERLEVRFDSPGDVDKTMIRTAVRQCQCLKCGTTRDVQIAVLIDPTPGAVPQPSTQRRPSNPNTSAPRRHNTSKVTQRYTTGYSMPGTHDAAPPQALPPQVEPHNATPGVRSPSPVQKKQCPACTFLNHAELTTCEMCQNTLPDTVITKPPSPVQQKVLKPSHAHSASMPSNSRTEEATQERPSLLNTVNRYSMGLGSTLFSYSPFAQQQMEQQRQMEQNPNMPPITQPRSNEPRFNGPLPSQPDSQAPTSKTAKAKSPVEQARRKRPATPEPPQQEAPISPPTPPTIADPDLPKSPWDEPSTPSTPPNDAPSSSSHHHSGMTFMPLTPPPVSENIRRVTPLGLPQNLMDDYVPVSPAYVPEREEDELNAGWGEVSREEARRADDSEDESDGEGGKVAMVDLDAIAQEVGVWGEREEDE